MPSVSQAFSSTSSSESARQLNESVETHVRNVFVDAPIMVEVARCESRFRQFDDQATSTQPEPVVLMGGYKKRMVGIFQIYDDIHRVAARTLGWNIDTIDGNIGYARYMYDKQGTTPWLSSSGCWANKKIVDVEQSAPVNAMTTTTAISSVSSVVDQDIDSITTSSISEFPDKNLKLGMIDPQVKSLQKALNEAGYRIAESGPGAPGQETEKFGALTRQALRRFQCSQNIVCSGSEGTTGYGLAGTRTRAALFKLAFADVR